MSNHLVRGLTTTNTRKQKKLKFSSAEEKHQYLEYQKWREELKSSLKPAPSKPARLKSDYSFVRETPHIPSRMETDMAVAARKESRVYDGERRLIGIATLHKSNMQPVFDEEYAKDVARMRRG
jgi:hypothetical protein